MAEFVQQGAICYLKGRLSQVEVIALWSRRQQLAAANTSEFNLSQLDFVDSAGVAFLLELVALQQRLNQEAVLSAPASQLKNLIALYDLDGFFAA